MTFLVPPKHRSSSIYSESVCAQGSLKSHCFEIPKKRRGRAVERKTDVPKAAPNGGTGKEPLKAEENTAFSDLGIQDATKAQENAWFSRGLVKRVDRSRSVRRVGCAGISCAFEVENGRAGI